MRSVMLSMVVLVLAALAAPVPASGLADSSDSRAASVSEPQTVPPPADINGNRDGGGVPWYRRPLRIVLGGGVILVLLLLVVRAVRGGGTTGDDAGYEDRIRSAEAEIKAASKELKK